RWWEVNRLGALTALAIVLALAGGALWIATSRSRELRSAEGLLAEASTKRRPFEGRLPAASYTRQAAGKNNDNSAFERPIMLLEAESRIAKRLAIDPDDAAWLRLRARAEMLDGSYNEAVETLRRAADAQPDDVSLLADLGCAYALRAEGDKREIDYGAAIDTLWRFLRARPDDPVALFNRAVVYERMFLYKDAVEDWEHYL